MSQNPYQPLAGDVDCNINASVATSARPAGVRVMLQLQSAETTSFSGILICCLHWKDDEINGDSSDWKPCGDTGTLPTLALACQLSCEVFEQDILKRESTREMVLVQSMRIEVSSQMPLSRFPFDRQQLRVGLTCRNFRLQPWHLQMAPELDQWFTDENSKSCHIACECRSFHLVKVKPLDHFQNAHASYTRMLFLLERVPAYYLWNYVFTAYLLVLPATLVACVEPAAVTDRASILLTLLLALVAQKFVSAQNLPVLDYHTLLDVYLRKNSGMKGCCCSQGRCAKSSKGHDLAKRHQIVGLWLQGHKDPLLRTTIWGSVLSLHSIRAQA